MSEAQGRTLDEERADRVRVILREFFSDSDLRFKDELFEGLVDLIHDEDGAERRAERERCAEAMAKDSCTDLRSLPDVEGDA